MLALMVAAMFFAPVSSIPVKLPNVGLPELNEIKTVTLSPSYSCRSEEEFQKGYATSGLFISTYSKQRNAPDLLFNGACGSEDYFEGATAGDDMSMIADLGTEPLEDVTAARVFNLQRTHSFDLYSKFARDVRVENKHTYALLIDKREVRGLVLFTVTAYQPNRKIDLRYAVKEYQLLSVTLQAEGFAWDAKNLTDRGRK
jgi:hypothetical protein